MRRFLNKFKVRNSTGFFILASICVSVALVILFFIIRGQIRQQVQIKLKDIAGIVAKQIDGDLHASLVEPSQENSPEYIQIRCFLQEVRDSTTDLAYVYTMRIQNGQVVFIVDAETDQNLVSHLGDVYQDIDPAVFENILNITAPVVDKTFYTDQWGTTMSGYAPIFTSDGRRDAILGVDIRLESVLRAELQTLLWIFIVFIIFICITGFISWQFYLGYSRPLSTLTEGVQQLSQGDYNYKFDIEGPDELSSLVKSVSALAENMNGMVNSLEQRVSLRTAELEQRSLYLEITAKVSKAASSILEPERLMRQVVEFIREQFGFYFVGLYLVDPTNSWAVLRAATGKSGQILIARGQRVRIGEGMVGWVIANAQPRISLEVGQDALKLSTPELPLTRSEAVLPLAVRGRLIGALMVQSDQSGAFDRLILEVLQLLADQIAIALDNARLFLEAQESYNVLQNSLQQYSSQAWLDYLKNQLIVGYQINAQGIVPIQRGSVFEQKIVPVTVQTTLIRGSEVTLPIKIRGRVLGIIIAKKPENSLDEVSTWNEDEVRLIQDMLDQLIVALDNARLYNVAQRSADRERILADVTANVRSSTNINTILHTAVQQLADALRIPKGLIMLRPIHPELHQGEDSHE